MSQLLDRWGSWSAKRPWSAIGAWVLVSVLVVAASAGFGKQLDDSMAAPGTDSQAAADLLASADSGAGGLTAYVVATSSQDSETFVDAGQARVGLDQLESALGDLPKVLGTTEEVSPDGRVALVRVQYPEIGELAVSDLDALKAVLTQSMASSSLRLEAGGDLYFSFEQPPANVGEVIGLVVAAVILLVAFGSLWQQGCRSRWRCSGCWRAPVAPAARAVIDIPARAPATAAMVGLGVGIDYALFLLSRDREYLAAGVPVAESVGRATATAGKAVVLPAEPWSWRSSGCPSPGFRSLRSWRRHLGSGARDGAGRGHPAARPARPGRSSPPDTWAAGSAPARARTQRGRRGAAVVPLGCARLPARRRVRRRRHDAAPRAGRARPRPAAGSAGPGQLPGGAHRAAGLRPRR